MIVILDDDLLRIHHNYYKVGDTRHTRYAAASFLDRNSKCHTEDDNNNCFKSVDSLVYSQDSDDDDDDDEENIIFSNSNPETGSHIILTGQPQKKHKRDNVSSHQQHQSQMRNLPTLPMPSYGLVRSYSTGQLDVYNNSTLAHNESSDLIREQRVEWLHKKQGRTKVNGLWVKAQHGPRYQCLKPFAWIPDLVQEWIRPEPLMVYPL